MAGPPAGSWAAAHHGDAVELRLHQRGHRAPFAVADNALMTGRQIDRWLAVREAVIPAAAWRRGLCPRDLNVPVAVHRRHHMGFMPAHVHQPRVQGILRGNAVGPGEPWTGAHPDGPPRKGRSRRPHLTIKRRRSGAPPPGHCASSRYAPGDGSSRMSRSSPSRLKGTSRPLMSSRRTRPPVCPRRVNTP